MKFMDATRRDLILVNMESDTREGVLAECAEAFQRAGVLQYGDNFPRFIIKREELGSTAIGGGVAVPHTKWPEVDRLYLVVGTTSQEIDWNALDGEPVQIIFLILSPPDRPGDHLRMLEAISRVFRDDTFLRFLRQSQSVDDVCMLLEEADDGQFG